MPHLPFNSILPELKVLDLTARLPGPFATQILQSLGAKVTKVELQTHLDPFFRLEAPEPLFTHWYEKMNEEKEILVLDFHQPDNAKRLQKLIEECHIVVSSWPLSWITKNVLPHLKMVPGEFSPKVFIHLQGHRDGHPLHDLNSLAATALLSLHLGQKIQSFQEGPPPLPRQTPISLPFLPIGGICFGHIISTSLLALALKSLATHQLQSETLYMQDVVTWFAETFYDEEYFVYRSVSGQSPSHLHNGRFPCYNIYPCLDEGNVVIAAIEEKFWSEAVKVFSWNLRESDRFDDSGKTYKVLANYFKSKTKNEILKLLGPRHICIDVV
jgi:alpha-methylacyl-CoA racemase